MVKLEPLPLVLFCIKTDSQLTAIHPPCYKDQIKVIMCYSHLRNQWNLSSLSEPDTKKEQWWLKKRTCSLLKETIHKTKIFHKITRNLRVLTMACPRGNRHSIAHIHSNVLVAISSTVAATHLSGWGAHISGSWKSQYVFNGMFLPRWPCFQTKR